MANGAESKPPTVLVHPNSCVTLLLLGAGVKVFAERGEASVAEGGCKSAVARGVGQQLSDQVEVARRPGKAERHGVGDEGRQNANGVMKLLLDGLLGGDDRVAKGRGTEPAVIVAWRKDIGREREREEGDCAQTPTSCTLEI